MSLLSESDIKEIERIAVEAGQILLDKASHIGQIDFKADGSGIVTEADRASEEFIIFNLENSFPGSSFLAEESGLSKNAGRLDDPLQLGNRWIIDPLDGTNNYAHQFPWYCVSIGLEMNGEMVAGVIYQPVLKELFSASKGNGAFLNGQEISVSSVKKLEESLLTVGFYYYRDEILDREVELFRKVHKKALGIRRPGSAALDLAYVAAGRLDGYWERGLNSWDMAAGYVIAREAGARFSKYNGKEFSIYEPELLVTNGLIHEQLQSLLK